MKTTLEGVLICDCRYLARFHREISNHGAMCGHVTHLKTHTSNALPCYNSCNGCNVFLSKGVNKNDYSECVNWSMLNGHCFYSNDIVYKVRNE